MVETNLQAGVNFDADLTDTTVYVSKYVVMHLCYNHDLTVATAARLCCLCGVNMEPNPSGMCVNCIRSQVDITAGIPKSLCIQHCRSCDR